MERLALSRLPLAKDAVERIYGDTLYSREMVYGPDNPALRTILQLCISHERLRMELEGLVALSHDKVAP